MQIIVRDIDLGDLRLDVNSSDTVEQLVSTLCDRWDIPSTVQRLIYGGKQLESDRTLSDYHIHDGSSLNLVRRTQVRLGLQTATTISISVKFEGRDFEIQISDDMFVIGLRERLARYCDVDRSEILVLFRDGAMLQSDDYRTLQEIGLVKGSALEIKRLTTLPYVIFAELPNGSTVPITVIHTDSIKSVKEILEKKFGVLHQDHVISFQGRSLADHEKLWEWGLDPGAKINVLPASGVAIVVQEGDLTRKGFYVLQSDLVSSLKVKVSEAMSVPVAQQEISIRGQLLEDDRTLGSYDIRNRRLLDMRRTATAEMKISRVPNEDQQEQLSQTSEPSNHVLYQDDDADTTAKDGVHGMHLLTDMAGGLLTDMAVGLSTGNWEPVRKRLPEFMKLDVEYKASCWTYTPSSEVLPHDVPLTIAGLPVVIPVDYRYPIMGAVAPPPDPQPRHINPRAPLDIKTIAMIFKEFPDAIGLYVLINGLLQIIVPEEFDYEWASSYRPNEFGRLKVCYIRQSMDATAGQVPISQQSILTSNSSGTLRSSRNPFSFRSQKNSTVGPSSTLKLEHAIEARVKESSAKMKHAGRIGVKTLYNGKIYLTMSSHVIINAFLGRYSESIFRKWRNNSQLSEGWIAKVNILVHGTKIGYVSETFDPDAKDYPNGFKYDTSLVKPWDERDLKDMKSPIPNLGWLSDKGWNNLRRGSVNLKVLEDEATKAKTIPSFTPSECLVVGEGIFLNRNKLFASQKETLLRHGMENQEELQIWKSLISRSLLYRVAPDFAVPGGQSGLALYADGEREDATTGPGVVGFQSFVQRSGHVQTYEMEGRDLESRLRKGLVAFYGAFRVPEIMRREHVIL